MIASILYKALFNDDGANGIREALAEYKGRVAIFTTSIPDDANYPAIAINDIGGAQDFGCRGKEGGTPTADVTLYVNKTPESEALCKSISILIWQFLSRNNFAAHLPTGWENWGVSVTLPRVTQDQDGFVGRTVSVNLRLLT